MKHDHGLARTDDPDTSHEAAASINATRIERIVLEAFWKSPSGLIAEEVSLLTRLPLNTVTPRIAPLERKGYIIPTGKRKGSSGRNQRVYKWISDQ